MYRKIALGLGLVLDFVGMIVFLVYVENYEYYGYYDGYGITPFLIYGASAAIVGFLLLFFGIVLPHPTAEPVSGNNDIKK